MTDTKNYPIIVNPNVVEHEKNDEMTRDSSNKTDTMEDRCTLDQINKMRELVPKINKFMIDINTVKKRIVDGTSINADTEKLDVLMKCITLYNNPCEIELIKEYHDEKEKNRVIQEARKRRIEEYEERHKRMNNMTSSIFHGFNGYNFSDLDDIKTQQFSSEEEIPENSSEDEHMHDEYIEMLDRSLENLSNGVLKQNMSIHRYYVSETSVENGSDKNKLWDQETDDESGGKDNKNVTINVDNGNEADDETSDTEIEITVNLSDIEIVPDPDPTDDENDVNNINDSSNKTGTIISDSGPVNVKDSPDKDWTHEMILSVIKSNIESIM